MNNQKQEILKILISTYIGEDTAPKISLREATERLAARENRAERTGNIIGGLIVAFGAAFVLVAFLLINQPGVIPDRNNVDRALSDTLQMNQGDLSRDSSVTPELLKP